MGVCWIYKELAGNQGVARGVLLVNSRLTSFGKKPKSSKCILSWYSEALGRFRRKEWGTKVFYLETWGFKSTLRRLEANEVALSEHVNNRFELAAYSLLKLQRRTQASRLSPFSLELPHDPETPRNQPLTTQRKRLILKPRNLKDDPA